MTAEIISVGTELLLGNIPAWAPSCCSATS